MAGVKKSVTLRDVARVAGVSAPMVSRVLNGTGRASPATRKAILEAVERLDYRPDVVARSLASGRSLTIGILCPQNLRGFAIPILVGAQRTLIDHDFASFLYSVDPTIDGMSWNEGLRRLAARRVDAVLVIGNTDEEVVSSISPVLSVPAIYAFIRSTDPADDVLTPDGAMAGRLAGRHLVESGRERIAHVTGPRELPAVQAREQGLRDALSEAGLELALGEPLYGDDWLSKTAESSAQLIVQHRSDVDAVFCGNDRIASGLYSVLLRNGVRVPDDIALVGYDHASRLDNEPDDFLTTIDPNLPELGETAVQHLTAALSGDVHHGRHLTPCTLVPGRSSRGRASAERI